MRKEVEMVPKQPPRRTKAEKEPVTIDLTADQTDTVAEPVRSNDTDDTAPNNAAAEPTETALTPDEEQPKIDIADEPVASLSADQPAYDAPPGAESQPDPEPMAAKPEPEPVMGKGRAEPQHKSTSAAAMIAAGIFGGLVALALAGSMQYAGYLPAASPAPAAGNSSSLSSEIAALQADIQALKSRPASADSSLAGRVQALETAAAQAPTSDLTPRLAAIERQLGDVKSATDASAGSDADLARRLEEAEAKINDEGPEQQAARAVAAAGLKAAIDRGGPFETELMTYASVADNDPAVAELQKFGAAGVPSRAELQREFPRIADAMLDAAAQPDAKQGLAGRLLSSAMSVVKVRRVGDVEGDSPEAVVARMEEGLRNGDLQASAREWNTLPEPARIASQDFKQKLDARIQVENLVGGTLTRAVTGTQG
jgi:hypothetical protein